MWCVTERILLTLRSHGIRSGVWRGLHVRSNVLVMMHAIRGYEGSREAGTEFEERIEVYCHMSTGGIIRWQQPACKGLACPPMTYT